MDRGHGRLYLVHRGSPHMVGEPSYHHWVHSIKRDDSMTNTNIGTDLYQEIIAFNHGDDVSNRLAHMAWDSTPFVVNVFTGEVGGDRFRKIGRWCSEKFGNEAWPLHGRNGSWYRGCVTIFGWAWFGFSTAEQLKQFLEQWP